MYKLFTFLFYFAFLQAQSFQISGLILDNQTKLPISDVNIIAAERGTASDIDGKFSLYAEKNDSITFSHI